MRLIALIWLIFVQPFGLDGPSETAKCKSVVMKNVKVGVALGVLVVIAVCCVLL